MAERKRSRDVHMFLSEKEYELLTNKADECCLSRSDFIRFLILGYQPRAKPTAEFYESMRQLSAIGNNLNQIAAKANATGIIDSEKYADFVKQFNKFQLEVERKYLNPAKEDDYGSK